MSDQAAYDVESILLRAQGARRDGPVDADVGVGARQPGGVPRAARGVDRDTAPGAAPRPLAAQGARGVPRPGPPRGRRHHRGRAGPGRAHGRAHRGGARGPPRRADVVDDAEAPARQLRHEAEDYVDQKLAAVRGRARTDDAGGRRRAASGSRSSSSPRPIPRPSADEPEPEMEELAGSIEVEAELEETFFDQDAR